MFSMKESLPLHGFDTVMERYGIRHAKFSEFADYSRLDAFWRIACLAATICRDPKETIAE
jgi:hypothetical protein